MATYIGVVEVSLGPGEKFYGLIVGFGGLCMCDGWILELSDLDVLGIAEDEEVEKLLEKRVFSDGVLLFEDREPLEVIAKKIMEKHPEGFCLGCERIRYRARRG
jgi:hypothetical protein